MSCKKSGQLEFASGGPRRLAPTGSPSITEEKSSMGIASSPVAQVVCIAWLPPGPLPADSVLAAKHARGSTQGPSGRNSSRQQTASPSCRRAGSCCTPSFARRTSRTPASPPQALSTPWPWPRRSAHGASARPASRTPGCIGCSCTALTGCARSSAAAGALAAYSV